MLRYREVISYLEMVQREGIALQKGMNFRVRGGAAGYSIILMSVRKGAPYQDQWHDETVVGPHAGMLEYVVRGRKRSGLRKARREEQSQFADSSQDYDRSANAADAQSKCL